MEREILNHNRHFTNLHPSLANLHPSKEALSKIDGATAVRLQVLPLEITSGGILRVIAQNPRDLPCADELRSLTHMQVDLIPSNGVDLQAEIRRAYHFSGKIAHLSEQYLALEKDEAMHEERLDDDSPAAKIVSSILEQALAERASDVHIEPGEDALRVRFRIDGRLIEALRLPLKMHPLLTSRIKIMARMDIAEKRHPQDGRIVKEYFGRAIDMRISTLPSVRGEKTVLRLLDPEQADLGLENLGCEQNDLEKLEKLLRSPHGLILNTGPTGSGKTTTLYAMLRRLDLEQYNAIAVEDPVEYHIPGVTQVQVNERAGLTFASALRSILRQDPDIILVGEIRDVETAQLAVRAALTGHLVLATVHANDAASAPSRLMDMGVPSYLLASVLRGVMAQRLVRKLCPNCRTHVKISEEMLRALGLPEGTEIFEASGCATCSGRGYKGRSAIFQIMTVDDELVSIIGRGESAAVLDAAARKKGMTTLRQAALARVAEGVTSLAEAEAVCGENFTDKIQC